jgi:hypothetical protein
MIKSFDFFHKNIFTKTLDRPLASANNPLIINRVFASLDINTSQNISILNLFIILLFSINIKIIMAKNSFLYIK